MNVPGYTDGNSLDLGRFQLPINWHWDEWPRTVKGMTLTQIATLPGGLVQLHRIVRWTEKKGAMEWMGKVIATQLEQPAVAAVLDRELQKDRKAASKHFKRLANDKRRSADIDREMRDRQLEFGG